MYVQNGGYAVCFLEVAWSFLGVPLLASDFSSGDFSALSLPADLVSAGFSSFSLRLSFACFLGLSSSALLATSGECASLGSGCLDLSLSAVSFWMGVRRYSMRMRAPRHLTLLALPAWSK